MGAIIRLYVCFIKTKNHVNTVQNFTFQSVNSQAAQSYPVLLITLYLYINSILKIIRKSCVINLLRYIFI